jgi:hypothetical protein
MMSLRGMSMEEISLITTSLGRTGSKSMALIRSRPMRTTWTSATVTVSLARRSPSTAAMKTGAIMETTSTRRAVTRMLFRRITTTSMT